MVPEDIELAYARPAFLQGCTFREYLLFECGSSMVPLASASLEGHKRSRFIKQSLLSQVFLVSRLLGDVYFFSEICLVR